MIPASVGLSDSEEEGEAEKEREGGDSGWDESEEDARSGSSWKGKGREVVDGVGDDYGMALDLLDVEKEGDVRGGGSGDVSGEVCSNDGESRPLSFTGSSSARSELELTFFFPLFGLLGSHPSERQDDEAGVDGFRGLTLRGEFVRDAFWLGAHLAGSFLSHSLPTPSSQI